MPATHSHNNAPQNTPQHIDLLINARWIIPVVPENRFYENCTLAINKGVIIAIVPTAEAKKRFIATQNIDCNDHALMPGLINAHGHAAMSLLRGFADDYPLETWLTQHIWPTEKRWVNSEMVRDGAELAIAEMLLSGTTCFSDMYFFPEETAKAAAEAGIRCQLSFPIFDFPSAWGDGPDDYINKGMQLHDNYRNSSLINVAFGPHAPYTVSMQVLERVATLANETGLGIHIHLHETAKEIEDSLAAHGQRPLALLNDIGIIGPMTQCVHMTHINDSDIEILARSHSHIIHCPESNLKLASGFCPIGQLGQANINIALGTDGAASNNSLNLFSEMRTAALVGKAVANNPAQIPAAQALAMATINGARALGRDAEIGSLEIGKLADVIAIDLSDLAQQPIYNPISQLVYTHVGHRVSHVWIGGRAIVAQRQLLTLSRDAIFHKATQWHKKISAQ